MGDNVSSVKLFFRSQTETNYGSKKDTYVYREREREKEREREREKELHNR